MFQRERQFPVRPAVVAVDELPLISGRSHHPSSASGSRSGRCERDRRLDLRRWAANALMGRTRYRLLETIRQYGQQRLTESEQEPVLRRRRAAMDFCVTQAGHSGNAAAALEIAADLVRGNAAFFGGRVTEARAWLRRALQLNPQPTPARAKGLALAPGFHSSGWWLVHELVG